MMKKGLELANGAELTMSEFQGNKTDIKYFVASGGYIYITEGGRPRMAVVPASVAMEYYGASSTEHGNPSELENPEDVPDQSEATHDE